MSMDAASNLAGEKPRDGISGFDERAPRRRVLAFEAFDAGSHRAVRESITNHSRHRWTWFTRPGRTWKWRMRLGSIELVDDAKQAGALDQPVEVIFATSMLGLTDLIAALPAAVRGTPAVLYMHENQIAYPEGHETAATPLRDVQFALTNLTSVLSADRVIWNSEWNRRSFVRGIERLLRKAPDVHLREVERRIDERSTVIWPPVEPPPEVTTGAERVLHNPIRVVWPHRWEHDKGPEDLFALAERFTEPLNLRWTVLGERYRRVPPEIEAFGERFADRIDHIGFEPDRAAYWRHLRRCDWVLSTAQHEFFGIAVVEAMLAGCLPWLPERLSYPELLPNVARGLSPASPPADPEVVRRAIRSHLEPAAAEAAVERIDRVIDAAAKEAADGDRRS
jgi:glycosyltransferase involved in cell wall biosynthesis